MEWMEERAVGSGSEGTEPCDKFLRSEYDLEGGEAVEVGVSGLSVSCVTVRPWCYVISKSGSVFLRRSSCVVTHYFKQVVRMTLGLGWR